MREFFETYYSNTLAASGNQSTFETASPKEIITGRSFYRVFAGGTYNYSLLFGNTVDSTYADGTHSHANLVPDEWTIHALRVCVCKKDCDKTQPVLPFAKLTIHGQTEKQVAPGEFFHTDSISLTAEEGDYICVEMDFSGTVLPYLEEAVIPVYVKQNGVFVPSKRVPLPAMVGCDRKADRRIVFWGDSITEGIGVEEDSYENWAAQLAENAGRRHAFWNLGIGYARAEDAATGGAWYYKAKHTDIALVCFGVNDLYHSKNDLEALKRNILRCVTLLKGQCKVVLLSTPPFDYTGEIREKWEELLQYERDVIAPLCDGFFPTETVWGKPDAPHLSRYGGHPNAEGCKAMADALKDYLSRQMPGIF